MIAMILHSGGAYTRERRFILRQPIDFQKALIIGNCSPAQSSPWVIESPPPHSAGGSIYSGCRHTAFLLNNGARIRSVLFDRRRSLANGSRPVDSPGEAAGPSPPYLVLSFAHIRTLIGFTS